MPLKDAEIRAFPALEKPYKKADGKGLYIEVFPNGSKLWRLVPHVFVRPGELRHAEWNEFDLEEAIWRIPAGKMKARRPHAVPLSPQVVSLFKELRQLTGPDGYAFPAMHTSLRPMSENTVNAAFRRMGFDKDEVTAHRRTASGSR